MHLGAHPVSLTLIVQSAVHVLVSHGPIQTLLFGSLFVSEVAPELVECTRITNYHLPDVEQIGSKGKV